MCYVYVLMMLLLTYRHTAQVCADTNKYKPLWFKSSILICFLITQCIHWYSLHTYTI